MAAVASGGVSPALCLTVLRSITAVDPWMADATNRVLSDILSVGAQMELPLVPAALGAVLPLLVADPDRLRLALDLVVDLDLHEAADGLAGMVWAGQPDAILAAAALAPSTDRPDFTDLIKVSTADLPHEWQRDLARTRLDPLYEPTSEPARVDRRARWLPPEQDQSLPAICVTEPLTVLGWRGHLLLLAEFARLGVLIRRPLDDARRRLLPTWVKSIGEMALDDFRIEYGDMEKPQARRIAIRHASALIGVRPRADVQAERDLVGVEADLGTMEVFDQGALPRPETAYLTGLRKRRLSDVRNYESLQPHLVRSTYYWTFSQVVGLRAAHLLFAKSDRVRGMLDVADRLVRLARKHQAVPVATTATGEILVNGADGLYNVESGQYVSEEVVSIDAIYQPFDILGVSVPALLRPSRQTKVNPDIVGGLPHIDGTRVPASTIGNALTAARKSNVKDPTTSVAEMFGLREDQVKDADSLMLNVWATR
jgi:uncharacterized protein (DUF433 family)